MDNGAGTIHHPEKKSAGNRGQKREVCGPANFQEVIYRFAIIT